MSKGHVILYIRPLHSSYNGLIKTEGETISAFPVEHLPTL